MPSLYRKFRQALLEGKVELTPDGILMCPIAVVVGDPLPLLDPVMRAQVADAKRQVDPLVWNMTGGQAVDYAKEYLATHATIMESSIVMDNEVEETPLVGFEEPRRQTGKTQAQMAAAPNGSFYLWPNNQLDYPKKLAQHIRRFDLRIYSIELALWENARVLYGTRHAVVLDHACMSFDVLNVEGRIGILQQLEAEGRLVK